MKCKGITNGEGLRYPSRYKAEPNAEEELFIIGWDLVSAEVHRLREEGWKLDQSGKRDLAGLRYQAANIFFYLIHYGIIIRNYTVKQKACTSEDKFNLKCVIKRLPCLSKEYGTDYVNPWKRMMELFGIGSFDELCRPCCQGIGSMIIGGEDECTAFIIGGCDLVESPKENKGEFTKNEFVKSNFTKDI